MSNSLPHMSQYNKLQTEWRKQMLEYLLRNDSFGTDIANDNTSKEMLASWGVLCTRNNQGVIVLDLAEDNKMGATVDGQIIMSHENAEVICIMWAICESEINCPNVSDLVVWIQKTYPDLELKYNYLPWPF